MDTEGVVISFPVALAIGGDFVYGDCSYGADDNCVWEHWTRRGLISPIDSFATAVMDTEGVGISLPVAPAIGGDFVCGDCSCHGPYARAHTALTALRCAGSKAQGRRPDGLEVGRGRGRGHQDCQDQGPGTNFFIAHLPPRPPAPRGMTAHGPPRHAAHITQQLAAGSWQLPGGRQQAGVHGRWQMADGRWQHCQSTGTGILALLDIDGFHHAFAMLTYT